MTDWWNSINLDASCDDLDSKSSVVSIVNLDQLASLRTLDGHTRQATG